MFNREKYFCIQKSALMKIFILMIISISSLAHAESCQEIDAQRFALAADPNYKPQKFQLLEFSMIKLHWDRVKDQKKTFSEINEPLKILNEAYPLSIKGLKTTAAFLAWISANGDQKSKDEKIDTELKKISIEMDDKANLIIKCILSSGNGYSEKSAYNVINIPEEYSILEHLKLKPVKQYLIESENKQYDVFDVDDHGISKKIYFNVTSFYSKY